MRAGNGVLVVVALGAIGALGGCHAQGAKRHAQGRAAAAAGRPGAAIKALDDAVALGDHGARSELAALLVRRARARAGRMERTRWKDFERAAELDGKVKDGIAEERRLALVDGGLLEWGLGDAAAARKLWKRAPGAHPMAVELVAGDAEGAALPLVGAAAARAYRVSGQAAAEWLAVYPRRGGDDAAVLAMHASAERAKAKTMPADDGAAGEIVAPAWREARPPGCPQEPEGASASLAAVAAGNDEAALAGAARAYVDGADAPACRGAQVIALYLGRKDGASALAWAEELLAIEPSDEDVLALAVLAAVATHDGPRARLVVEQAEYYARRRGGPSLAAGRAFLAAGMPIEALHAGREALALADGSDRYRAFELLYAAASAAGRDADAEAYARAYEQEAGPAARTRLARGIVGE